MIKILFEYEVLTAMKERVPPNFPCLHIAACEARLVACRRCFYHSLAIDVTKRQDSRQYHGKNCFFFKSVYNVHGAYANFLNKIYPAHLPTRRFVLC